MSLNKTVPTVMYMGPNNTYPKVHYKILAWPWFLEAALGVIEIPKLSYWQVAWSNSVIFFDTNSAPDNWVELVEHLLEQNNRVIVVTDAGSALKDMHTLHEAGVTNFFIMERTWEAREVRRFFRYVHLHLRRGENEHNPKKSDRKGGERRVIFLWSPKTKMSSGVFKRP